MTQSITATTRCTFTYHFPEEQRQAFLAKIQADEDAEKEARLKRRERRMLRQYQAFVAMYGSAAW